MRPLRPGMLNPAGYAVSNYFCYTAAMPIFNVSPQKEEQLTQEMARVGVREADLEEWFIRGSGAGGQKINKTSSCVVLRHRPTGIEVRCQRERSQALNRFLARRELCERVRQKLLGERTARQQAAEKIRRQKRRRSRRQRARMLADKHHQAEKKSDRRPVSADE
jgi:peptide chain release factor